MSGIITNKNGAVLLTQRPMHKKIAPGAYHIPGGHVKFDETPEQALRREILEELGLEVVPEEVIRTFSYTIDSDHTVGITFSLKVNGDIAKISYDKQDTESIEWVPRDDINKYLRETNHDYITLKKFFGN